VENETI
jgi:hypothetical protein